MNQKIDFDKIKVIIWDLDNTLWNGVISEGEVSINEAVVTIIKKTTDCGIINSICSKNDKNAALAVISNLGILDYFVFISIDWQPKGERIKKQLEAMGLKAKNALFIDDEHLNLQEAGFYNQDLMTLNSADVSELYEWSNSLKITDANQSRLKQYRILDKKNEMKKSASSNEDFLFGCHIRCEIVKDRDMVKENLDRISELVSRTNQLNYTKNRSSTGELLVQIESAEDIGYVKVFDDFGDYGIVGFYAIKHKQFLHLLFSCRTLGMGIEQYVYNSVRGSIICNAVGEVASELKENYIPAWINCNKVWQDSKEETMHAQRLCLDENHMILFKGPCDLQTIFTFIRVGQGVDCEFTYVSQNNGVSIESVSHTVHVLQADTISDVSKREMSGLPFGDYDMYSDLIYRHPYKVIFLSILQDAILGLYRNKISGDIVAYGQGYYPLTDQNNWEGYCDGTLYTAGCKWSVNLLRNFSEKYEFIGISSPEDTFQNIQKIRKKLSNDTKIVVLLGTETEWKGNKSPAWVGKNLWYQKCNRLIRDYCENRSDMDYVDVNNYITGQESFNNHYNHYELKVYYDMTQDIVNKIRNSCSDVKIASKNSFYLEYKNLKNRLMSTVYRILNRK